MTQQQPCPGAYAKVAKQAHKAGLRRQARCAKCGRTVHINYNGRLRRHVAKLR